MTQRVDCTVSNSAASRHPGERNADGRACCSLPGAAEPPWAHGQRWCWRRVTSGTCTALRVGARA